MKSQIKSSPITRFPRFSEEWTASKLKELFKISAGGDVPQLNVSKVKTEEFRYPIFANAEKNKGFYGYSNLYKISPPVVTVAGRGVNIGIAHERLEKFYPIVRLLTLEARMDSSTKFFEFAINNLNLFLESTGVPQLTSPQLGGYLISYPTLPEQKKIAAFLSAVDEKIRLLQRKRALLEQYKKGLMQQLFPSTGSGQAPELRFKQEDGSDFPEWERKELGDLLDYEQPTKYIVDSTEYNDLYSLPVLTAGKTFVLGYTDEKNGVFEANLPVIIFDDFTTAFKFVDFKFKVKSSAMKILISKDDVNSMSFIFNAMSQIKFPLGEHKRYWISEYQYMKIHWPCEAEQQKIASFLSAMDEKIGLVGQQVAQMQAFKKGLLQQMFV